MPSRGRSVAPCSRRGVAQALGRSGALSIPLCHGLAIVLGVAILTPSIPSADKEPERKLGIVRKDGELAVSFGYGDIFDEAAKAKLGNGLPTTVLMRMTLMRAGGEEPLSFTLRNSSITYDLWDEVYHLVVETPGTKSKSVVKDRDKAVSIATKAQDHPISIGDVPPGKYVLRVRVDRNPMNKAVLKGLRSWLNRPAGSGDRLKPDDSFFGSFISFFINKKIQKSEKSRSFKSQQFDL